MVDSESVAVGGEVAAWVTELLVVDEACREGKHAQCDVDADAEDGAAAVSLEPELAFAGERRAVSRDWARHRGAVKQPNPVTERRRTDDQVGDDLGDRGCQRSGRLL
jgi:hypothetical protein